MINSVIRQMTNPMNNITINIGTDKPLYRYVQQAIQDIEVINLLRMNPLNENSHKTAPFIYVKNWDWNPHPLADDIKYRRRETGTRVKTKLISDMRIGILSFDIYYGSRDKNGRIVQDIIHNEIYVPIEDENGHYLIDNILYSEYQLVDKLLYPSGKDSFTLKSLLPVIIKYEEGEETSINGYIVHSKIGMVKIFNSMEPILSCFMHVINPLAYLEVDPILRFVDHVDEDGDKYEYFQPMPKKQIYIKAYRDGLEKFDYVRSILLMSIKLIKSHKPETLQELTDPAWWVYKLSYHATTVEHRGACYQMHVARMLDTISAEVLPIPEVDKRIMISLLKYVLQTEFTNVDIYSYENKRIRLNEVISTIVTAEISEKLKRLFKFGTLIEKKDAEPALKFRSDMILKKLHTLGTVHVTDFTNDLDYPQNLRMTKKGQHTAA